MTTLVLTHHIWSCCNDACVVDGHLLAKDVVLVLMNEWYFSLWLLCLCVGSLIK
jgi:hypothetical protein